jgi:hypothetical protein
MIKLNYTSSMYTTQLNTWLDRRKCDEIALFIFIPKLAPYLGKYCVSFYFVFKIILPSLYYSSVIIFDNNPKKINATLQIKSNSLNKTIEAVNHHYILLKVIIVPMFLSVMNGPWWCLRELCQQFALNVRAKDENCHDWNRLCGACFRNLFFRFWT